MISRIPAGMMGIVAAMPIAGATSVALPAHDLERPGKWHEEYPFAYLRRTRGRKASFRRDMADAIRLRYEVATARFSALLRAADRRERSPWPTVIFADAASSPRWTHKVTKLFSATSHKP
jgi:hypothetical protein